MEVTDATKVTEAKPHNVFSCVTSVTFVTSAICQWKGSYEAYGLGIS
jgi:hypothetical protein